MPVVSVIIPTYNRSATLLRAINSVLRQSYVDFELLIVDDGSTDDTSEIVSSVSDPRLRYIRLPTNSGVSVARNRGIEAAIGKYIAFQDSDDEWLPSKLEKQVAAMESSPDIDFVFCALIRVSPFTSVVNRIPPRPLPNEREKFLELLLVRNFIWTQTWLVRAEILKGKYTFHPDILRVQDWDLALRIVSSLNYQYVDEVLVVAYYTEGSLLSLDRQRGIDLKIMTKTQSDLLGRYPKILARYCQGIAVANRAQKRPSYREGCYWSLRALRLSPLNFRYWMTFALALLGPLAHYVLKLVVRR